MGVSKNLIAFVSIALFTLAIFSFGFTMQNLNNVNQTILNDSIMSEFDSNINVVVANTTKDFTNISDAVAAESTKIPLGDIISNPLWGSSKKFLNLGRATLNTLGVGIETYVGVDPIFISLILALITMIGAFAWWKLIKSGQD
jgi:hypothetical protein